MFCHRSKIFKYKNTDNFQKVSQSEDNICNFIENEDLMRNIFVFFCLIANLWNYGIKFSLGMDNNKKQINKMSVSVIKIFYY